MKQNIIYLVVGLICLTGCNSPKQNPQDSVSQDAVASELPSVIEFVSAINDSISASDLKGICKEFNIDTMSIYQWRNHAVIYDIIDEPQKVIDRAKSVFTNISVKLYDKPFYIFDRKNCKNSETVKEWSHTIMTANLVSDTTLQKEYMDYHATQSEKFPEVANGFCNADFQQLLIFRNDRQLMLIISIPKGESLDELNPKTTENNPRVDEWNALMSKYQEGIEGNELGSAWVTFKQVK